MGTTDDLPELFHFRASHFNEKARWALDYKGIAHRRHALIPGFHIPPVLWMTGQKQVPVLRLRGSAIADSTRIIAALEAHRPDPALYPSDPADRARALALEEWFDEELGPHLRLWLFFALLPEGTAFADGFTIGHSAFVRAAYRALFPLTRTIMRRDMGLDAASAAEGRRRTLAAIDRLEAELAPTGYLVADRFTVADLTAAALFAPLVRPPEFPYPLLALPPEAAAFRASVVARPGMTWVRTMYARHRGRSAEVQPDAT